MTLWYFHIFPSLCSVLFCSPRPLTPPCPLSPRLQSDCCQTGRGVINLCPLKCEPYLRTLHWLGAAQKGRILGFNLDIQTGNLEIVSRNLLLERSYCIFYVLKFGKHRVDKLAFLLNGNWDGGLAGRSPWEIVFGSLLQVFIHVLVTTGIMKAPTLPITHCWRSPLTAAWSNL